LCHTLNQDKDCFFDNAKDPFLHLQERHPMLVKLTLVKEIGVDLILPCVMAMDKTHIDMAGRLQMEPITLSHGLLKHVVRRLPIAMRILGYINPSTPLHLPSLSEQDPELNAPADLAKGTV
jgi:hypothetical protein